MGLCFDSEICKTFLSKELLYFLIQRDKIDNTNCMIKQRQHIARKYSKLLIF